MVLHFVAPTANVGQLQIDTSGLSGDFEKSVTEIMTGSDNAIWINRISSDYFELPESVAQAHAPVVVITNGITGGLTSAPTGVVTARAACRANFATVASV